MIANRPRPRTGSAAHAAERALDRLLIVNADDFGMSPGINRGIIEAHRQGILTSTSLMATGDAFDDAIALSRAHLGLSVGVHLTLAEGAPVCPPDEIPSLVGPDGRFPQTLGVFLKAWFMGRLRAEDVARELAAQVEKVLDHGVQVDKLDSHMHVHVLPGILPTVLATARRYGIRAIRRPVERLRYLRELPGLRALVRRTALSNLAGAHAARISMNGLRTPDHFSGIAESGALTEPHLLRIVRDLKPGVTEIMTHPGHRDAVIDQWRESCHYRREGDLQALLSAEVKNVLQEHGIALVTFRDLLQND
jgi:hopanoid biosynthesis associated protein HpnK